MPIKSLIRTIPDYPRPGIQFRDITTLLQDRAGMRLTLDKLAEPFLGRQIDKVAGIEARGFILGGALAQRFDAGFVPVRKKGKLPYTTIGQDYELEYGTESIEMHTDAIAKGESVLMVDDLVATGGTALAAVELIRKTGGEIVGCTCIVDLPDLGGSRKLREAGVTLHALCAFEGE
jgi:adenine phosphoribosyltransferase